MKEWLDRIRTSVETFWGVDQSIPLYGPDTTWLDILGAVSSVSAFVALIFAGISVLQNTKSRNLSTIVEFTAQLAQERRLGFEAKVFGDMSDSQIHAYQMAHLVESAAFIINRNMITGQAKAFLLDWLAVEVPHMEQQKVYQDLFSSTIEGEMAEFFRLRKNLARQHAKRERELLQLRHWDKLERDDLRERAAALQKSLSSQY
jgi:hypothetical protein